MCMPFIQTATVFGASGSVAPSSPEINPSAGNHSRGHEVPHHAPSLPPPPPPPPPCPGNPNPYPTPQKIRFRSMALLQVPRPTFYSSSLLERSARWAALSSSWSGDRCSPDAIWRSLSVGRKRRSGRKLGSVLAMADPSMYKMNLNEYMVTLEKPLGVRFALSVDGKIFVHSLKRGGNAEKSRIIMVGDMLKKASNKSGGGFIDIKDLSDTEYGILPFARVL